MLLKREAEHSGWPDSGPAWRDPAGDGRRVLPLVGASRTASRRNSGVGLFPFPIEHLLVPQLVLSTFQGKSEFLPADQPLPPDRLPLRKTLTSFMGFVFRVSAPEWLR
ncbi:MAG: hypothetical protein KDE00_12845 [Rhodobacteraceae bacterium]|nr:hypothetical protein [Paracoccaceae bacterium]